MTIYSRKMNRPAGGVAHFSGVYGHAYLLRTEAFPYEDGGFRPKRGNEMRQIESRDEFIAFYNGFAESKGLQRFDRDALSYWGRKIFGFAVVSEDKPLAMYSYVIDRAVGRARRLHSASLFRNIDKAGRAVVGRANRFLHYAKILNFKEMVGYEKDSKTRKSPRSIASRAASAERW